MPAPPIITSQPQNLTVTNGNPASFSVTADGAGPLSYQWRLNGTNLASGTATTLTIPSAHAADAGGYTVVVNNNSGSATSSVATLTVLLPPTIVTQPTNQTVYFGSNAAFAVVASGVGSLTYQWWFAPPAGMATQIANATNDSLTLTQVQPTNGGNYHVVVVNSIGSINSVEAALTVLDGDADGDGMPDFWELANGLDPFANDAGGDPDGDGKTNVQEYLSGTNPKDSASVLKIDYLVASPGTFQLRFLAVSNKTYSVQFRDALNQGIWQSLTNVPARSTNRVETVNDSATGPDGRFYRLVTPAQ